MTTASSEGIAQVVSQPPAKYVSGERKRTQVAVVAVQAQSVVQPAYRVAQVERIRTQVAVVGRQGPPGRDGAPGISEESMAYARRTDYTENDAVIYKGEAVPGSSETAPVWRIKRTTISPEGDVTEEWAALAEFTQVWADHLLLEYV